MVLRAVVRGSGVQRFRRADPPRLGRPQTSTLSPADSTAPRSGANLAHPRGLIEVLSIGVPWFSAIWCLTGAPEPSSWALADPPPDRPRRRWRHHPPSKSAALGIFDPIDLSGGGGFSPQCSRGLLPDAPKEMAATEGAQLGALAGRRRASNRPQREGWAHACRKRGRGGLRRARCVSVGRRGP